MPTNGRTLTDLPPEILELVAYYSATHDILGPPTSLASLLCTNKALNGCLSFKANPLLYASIFEAKFDLGATRRRYGAEALNMVGIAAELKRRFINLKRIRSLDGTVIGGGGDSSDNNNNSTAVAQTLLLQAYILMLENDSKNRRQLCEYAGFETWLERFWLDDNGSSLVRRCWETARWPPLTTENSMAMWLYWILLKPGESVFLRGSDLSHT